MKNEVYHPFEQVCEHKETISVGDGFEQCIEENGCGKTYRMDDLEARVNTGRHYNALEDKWIDDWVTLSVYEEECNAKAHNH